MIVFGTCLSFALCIYCVIEPLNVFAESKTAIKLVVSNIYSWIPGVLALAFFKKERMKVKIVTKFSQTTLLALSFPILFSAAGILITLCFEKFSLERVIGAAEFFGIHIHSQIVTAIFLILSLALISILTSLTVNFLFSLGEELFWRGYIWEKLRCLGFWKAALNIAVLSSLWMAPNIVFFGYMFSKNPLIGILLSFLINLAVTPILCYFREKEQGVMASTIFKAMMNSFCPFVVVFFPDSNPLCVAPLGLSGVLAMFLVLLVFMKITAKEKLWAVGKAP